MHRRPPRPAVRQEPSCTAHGITVYCITSHALLSKPRTARLACMDSPSARC